MKLRVAALVLAAGSSTRMGRTKALLEVAGRTFLERIAATARRAGAVEIVAVLGPPDGERIAARLPECCRRADNADPTRGMLSSMQAGIAVLQHDIDAALIWPVDLPLVAAVSVRALLDAAGEAKSPPITALQYNGRGGHPILIPRLFFAEVLALSPDVGLRALFDAHRASIVRVPVDDPGTVEDIDTPEDYARALANFRE